MRINTKGFLTCTFQVVPRHSAVIQNLRNVEEVALAAHHSNMVKYSSVDDPNFKKVALRLVKLAKNAIIVNDDDSGVENVIMGKHCNC